MSIFESLESEVRSYCRSWPVTFDRAKGSRIWDVDGTEYVDFFAGAGALNYGHNHPDLKAPLLEYLSSDRVVHSLDMNTVAKGQFLERFEEVILKPRGLDYKVQFPGPTGTNAVESALKLARKVTGKESIISFTNAFHGMTLGSLSVTGNSMKRGGAGIPLVHATPMPYDNYLDGVTPDFIWFERLLQDSGSGLNEPAAVIVETVQGEGGINVARLEWLHGLAELCKRHELLLIVDDVQMGCGRTGPFFSFEAADIEPDIVCMSKSISGYGLPMALTLFKPELDVWEPGEHNGTFRGQNPSFVTATAALNFWTDNLLEKQVIRKGEQIEQALTEVIEPFDGVQTRGRGLIRGVAFDRPELAGAVQKEAFARGLLLETSGPEGEVVKMMPPLVIDDDDLAEGLTIAAHAIEAVAAKELTTSGAKG
ncbi:diaminobutyrate--2-oxoglutarate transaminase [Mycolicibacter sinensis]|jgi:diaminobutyrate-2-oxoglutarate transaminase|uniref:Diaminobutyrate--2-oxoglutarate transaminase n=1 Tax=Mycolicibacter sinensis (strain JDM601) TaxID=875328 RepID=A0A1A2E4I1_MYCSD|nr:diaminobutyrate--2-oxoglutarate transaminase [Mycolicibacter sinensis]OBG00037.1 diaminobutyrate--2-oxoglutarate transaminase [Mycolicibacter sinensis]OBG07226.1 diaminobutyrate--2-oxoglutarate transaminase [Mycolicibacter sinensis]